MNLKKKIIIVSDKLWFTKFSENKMFCRKKNNIKLVYQLDYVNGKFRRDKINTSSFILNLSSLTINDILFVNDKYEYFNNIQFIEIIN